MRDYKKGLLSRINQEQFIAYIYFWKNIHQTTNFLSLLSKTGYNLAALFELLVAREE